MANNGLRRIGLFWLLLEEAGYIAVNKTFVERKPRTFVAATAAGRKVYGATVAVEEVSFEVRGGEIFGMVGPNGAGKTTTIECLEGLRKPDQGMVRVLGGFVLSSLSFFGLGFILAGTLPTVRAAWVTAMVLLYPMLFLSGAFFTVELLPAAVQKVSAFMPLTYVVNLLSGLWTCQPWGDHLLDVGVLTGMLLLGIIVSVKTFRWE